MLFLFIFPSTLISKPVEIYVQYVNEQGIEDFAHLLSEKDWKGAIRIVAKDDFFHGDELTVEEYAIRLWDKGSIMRNYEPYLVQKGDSVTGLLLNVVKELVEDKRMSRQKGTSLTKSVFLLVKVKGRTQPIPFSVSISDETIKPCHSIVSVWLDWLMVGFFKIDLGKVSIEIACFDLRSFAILLMML